MVPYTSPFTEKQVLCGISICVFLTFIFTCLFINTDKTRMYSETGLPMSHISQQAPVESDAASLLPQQDPSLFLFHENPNYNTHVSAAESKYIAASIRVHGFRFPHSVYYFILLTLYLLAMRRNRTLTRIFQRIYITIIRALYQRDGKAKIIFRTYRISAA